MRTCGNCRHFVCDLFTPVVAFFDGYCGIDGLFCDTRDEVTGTPREDCWRPVEEMRTLIGGLK